MTNRNFGLIGASGYVAPRHMRAIKETGNTLIVALDKNDSVGIMDQYFPEAKFFTEFERFDRFVYKNISTNESLDYISICSPNYLHDAHIRFALRSGSEAICEKPLVVNPWNIDSILTLEQNSAHRVNAILQLRLHPAIIDLKKKVESVPPQSKAKIELTYITPRGKWYDVSWKGSEEKSGGVVSNIGIHFFDMLSFVFGDIQSNFVHLYEKSKASGFLELKNAEVSWYLSVDAKDLDVLSKERKPFRSLKIDGEEVDFSLGFNDLHTQSYKKILSGDGFSVEDARASIEAVYDIRNSKISIKGDKHSLVRG